MYLGWPVGALLWLVVVVELQGLRLGNALGDASAFLLSVGLWAHRGQWGPPLASVIPEGAGQLPIDLRMVLYGTIS